jgi:hypothetical protein
MVLPEVLLSPTGRGKHFGYAQVGLIILVFLPTVGAMVGLIVGSALAVGSPGLARLCSQLVGYLIGMLFLPAAVAIPAGLIRHAKPL